MRQLGVTQAMVMEALQKANQSAGGSVVELAESEYMVRSRGFLQSLDDFRASPSAWGATPVLLRDVAFVQLGPEMRRGIAELDGEGEVPAAWWSCARARTRGPPSRRSRPNWSSSSPACRRCGGGDTYDRSLLIDRSVDNLGSSCRGVHRGVAWSALCSCSTCARRSWLS
jgi:Cu(I)/Ag(I) efflux system membrane protein CusA/SilA